MTIIKLQIDDQLLHHLESIAASQNSTVQELAWSEHFIWTADGLKIIGITTLGRAT